MQIYLDKVMYQTMTLVIVSNLDSCLLLIIKSTIILKALDSLIRQTLYINLRINLRAILISG